MDYISRALLIAVCICVAFMMGHFIRWYRTEDMQERPEAGLLVSKFGVAAATISFFLAAYARSPWVLFVSVPLVVFMACWYSASRSACKD